MGEAVEELLDWAEPWDTVLDESEAPFYKWFVGGLNASHQALDRHVEAGRATGWPSTGAARRARSAT